ncbi:helix-turn-helix domain-containing protein [Streptomyces calvus]
MRAAKHNESDSVQPGLGGYFPMQFMSVREVAEYLNVSASWVYRNASRSGLVPYRFGGGENAKIRFRASEVDAWVKQQRAS